MRRLVPGDENLAALGDPVLEPRLRLVGNAVHRGHHEEVVVEGVQATVRDALLGRVIGDVAEVLERFRNRLERGEIVPVHRVARIQRGRVDDAER